MSRSRVFEKNQKKSEKNQKKSEKNRKNLKKIRKNQKKLGKNQKNLTEPDFPKKYSFFKKISSNDLSGNIFTRSAIILGNFYRTPHLRQKSDFFLEFFFSFFIRIFS